MGRHSLTEDLYANVADWQTYAGYTDAERIAIEYAEKFALDHTRLDDTFFERMKKFYSDEEIMEISICVGTWLMMGRITMVMDVDVSCPLQLDLAEPETPGAGAA